MSLFQRYKTGVFWVSSPCPSSSKLTSPFSKTGAIAATCGFFFFKKKKCARHGRTVLFSDDLCASGQQPVSIAVEADQFFKTGATTATCGSVLLPFAQERCAMCETERDHGILAVGYGTECGTDEWSAISLHREWTNVASCPALHRILSCLGLHRLYLHNLRRLHTLPRSTGSCKGCGDVSYMTLLFKTVFFVAARHPAGIDMCPSAGTRGIGHVILDAMVSMLHRTDTAMQRAVLAYCERNLSKTVKHRIGVVFSFCDVLSTELSFLPSECCARMTMNCKG